MLIVFLASKSAAHDLAPEWVLGLCKTILEHLDAILCDFVHDLVHFGNWLPEQKKTHKIQENRLMKSKNEHSEREKF